MEHATDKPMSAAELWRMLRAWPSDIFKSDSIALIEQRDAAIRADERAKLLAELREPTPEMLFSGGSHFEFSIRMEGPSNHAKRRAGDCFTDMLAASSLAQSSEQK